MTLQVSVIIPAINESAHVGCAVRSAWRAGASQVLVSDGGSCDDTPRLAIQEGATVVSGAIGRGPQQNLAAASASGDVLLFLHADNQLGPDCIDQLRRSLARRGDVVGGCFRQVIEARGWTYRLLERGNHWRARWWRLPYGDQGIFVRREAFHAVQGFPNEPLMEDVAMVRSLAARGRLVVLPGPILVDARRWREHGVIRQTLRNWSLLAAYFAGVSPRTLVRSYRRHDVSP